MKDEMKMKAKMEMLKALKKKAMDDDFGSLKEPLSGKVKKVVISSDDEEGLEKGLSLAEKMLAKKKAMEKEMGMGDESSEEMMEEEEGCPVCGEMHEMEEGDEYSCGGMKE